MPYALERIIDSRNTYVVDEFVQAASAAAAAAERSRSLDAPVSNTCIQGSSIQRTTSIQRETKTIFGRQEQRL